jgi:hypothetical protein
MIKETGQNRVKGKLAGSGGRFGLRLVLMLWYIFVFGFFLFPVHLHAHAADSLSNRIDTISRSGNSARFLLCKWHYTGQNVSGISIIGITDYYGQNTSGYRINGLELSIDGGAKQLNGVGIGVGLLSPYGTVNGLLFQPFFTTATHLRGMALPCFAIDVDTLDGVAAFSLFAINNRLNGFSAAGFWQTSSIANGVVLSGVGHQYDDAFRGLAGCGIMGIYDGVFQGFSVSGIGHHFNGSASGLTISAVYNNATHGFNGVSVSLLRNKSSGQFNGLQVAAFCRTQTLSGVQAGFINRSNRLSGVQFGLINIVHSNPKGRRVLPFVNWSFSSMKDTVISLQKDSLVRYRIYGEDGFMKHEYFLKNGQQHGVERYYTAQNRIEKEISWQNGKKHGWEVDYLDPDLTALCWENDSLLLTRNKFSISLTNDFLSGTWFQEEYTSGKKIVFLVRDIQRDTINRMVDSVRSGLHFLGGAGSALVYGWFNDGKITGIYTETPRGKKFRGTIIETQPLNFEVTIVVREKNLFDYDSYSSWDVLGVVYSYFPKTCRIDITVNNPSGALLYTECLIKQENKYARTDTSCRYFRTEKHNGGQMIYYWSNDSVTSNYKNGRVAFRQVFIPGKTITRDDGSVVVVTKSATVYYKNKKCAAYQTKDTLILYSKRGKPVLRRFGDSTTVFRKDGSEFLFYCTEYRRYTSRGGKIIAERFGDSLVKYDDAGLLTYYALIKQDSIWVYVAGDTVPFISGNIYAGREIFDITEFQEIKGESDLLFLMLENQEKEDPSGIMSVRLYLVRDSIDPFFYWPAVYFERRK